MSPELEVLFYTTLFTFLLLAIQGALTPIFHGFKWGLGPRDDAREPTKFQGRANRIVANQIEAMVLFVPLIFIVHATGASSEATVTGAWVFFISRMLFALVYFLGIPVLRSFVWGVAVVGLCMIAIGLFSVL